ncbi:NAD(P)(+)--arginine ADP-ribosyltransferase 2-like isoform X2 [Chamaea fasciata]|uniref:NAD(P)(+)--arginine ADP-ribosyltransferase 2-like isoform X2 n=1 Tax=Chamaea fasciata TaxID=190680 RepID=UPI00336AA04D
MAPLAHTLALLAMAVATAAEEVIMDMAQDSFDDQYLKCSVEMSEKFQELQGSDFHENVEFKENWAKAMDEWKNRGSISSPLTPDQAVALMAYSMKKTNLYRQFNMAVQTAGSSSGKYRNEFHFKSLHFLLTRAIQTLRPTTCLNVFRGVTGYTFKVTPGDEVRFSQFTSTSLRKKVAQDYGKDTMFQVYTCHGADIQKFSYNKSEQEVLIPPFETFKVIKATPEGEQIVLQSTRTFSNYDCGSLPRNSLHLGGLLLATMAMAVVTGTL